MLGLLSTSRLERTLELGLARQQLADGQMALTGLVERDPDFDIEALCERCAEYQERFYAAESRDRTVSECAVMTAGLRCQVESSRAIDRALLRRVETYDISVERANIVEACFDGEFDLLYIWMQGEAFRRTMHTGTNRWMGGGTQAEPFEQIWGLVRLGDVVTRTNPGTLEGFCPDCGADLLEHGDTTACTTCGGCLNDGHGDWAVAFLGTPDGWRPSDVPPPDPSETGSCLTHMLDAVTTAFWKLRLAALHASTEPLDAIALPEFIARHGADFHAARDGRRSFSAQPRLGRIEWLGVSEGCPWFRVLWHGLPAQARVPSFVQDDVERATPRVDDVVLARASDGDGWRLRDVHRTQGEVPCPELLDTGEHGGRIERLPVMTAWERELLFQLCVVLLLRQGPLSKRRRTLLEQAGDDFQISPERLPELVRQVGSEGAALFGRECKLPPEILFRHVTRLSVVCGALHKPVARLLREVASALGLPALAHDELRAERRRVLEVVRRIQRASRRR